MNLKRYYLLLPIWSMLLFVIACSDTQDNKRSSIDRRTNTPVQSDTLKASFYRSSDDGLSWTPFDKGLPANSEVTCIDTVGDEIVIGTESHGLFSSPIGRVDWKPFATQLPGKKISAVHTSAGVTYIGVYQFGIYKSINNNKRWEALNGNLPDLKVRSILATESHVLVATDMGIFKLRKNQEDWQQVFSGDQVVSLNEFQGKIVGGTTSGVILSEDGGNTWDWIHALGPVHNTAILNENIFASYISGELYVSSDWGQSWVLANYAPRDASYVYELTNMDNTIIMSNNYGIHRSTDLGHNWSNDFKVERRLFFDFFTIGNIIYAGMR